LALAARIAERMARPLWLPRLMGWTPPGGIACQSGVVDHHLTEASMLEVSTIGLDLAKNVFQVHGANAS